MKTVKEILDSLSNKSSNKWRERAEWRKNNKHWIRKSQRIALIVLECMYEKNISKEELSEKIGVSNEHMNNILRGSENLSLEIISKLELALNIELISIVV